MGNDCGEKKKGWGREYERLNERKRRKELGFEGRGGRNGSALLTFDGYTLLKATMAISSSSQDKAPSSTFSRRASHKASITLIDERQNEIV
jgi:hypothetical protein